MIALTGCAVATLVAGPATGLAHGVAAGAVGGKLATVVGSAAAQLPAYWLPAAVTPALLSVASRLTPVTWGVLVDLLRCTCWIRCQDCRSGCTTWNHSRTSSGQPAVVSALRRCCARWQPMLRW